MQTFIFHTNQLIKKLPVQDEKIKKNLNSLRNACINGA